MAGKVKPKQPNFDTYINQLKFHLSAVIKHFFSPIPRILPKKIKTSRKFGGYIQSTNNTVNPVILDSTSCPVKVSC